MKGHSITPMKAERLRKQDNGWGKKRHPRILTNEQIMEAADTAFSEVTGTAPTITIKDVCRAAGIKPNPSVANDIRTALLQNGYIEHTRIARSYYTRPQGANA